MPDDLIARLRRAADMGHAPILLREAADELDRLNSWEGLMSMLDEHYPASIFTEESRDPGPRIVALLRQIHDLRETLDTPL